jgi:hypothetical protein
MLSILQKPSKANTLALVKIFGFIGVDSDRQNKPESCPLVYALAFRPDLSAVHFDETSG